VEEIQYHQNLEGEMEKGWKESISVAVASHTIQTQLYLLI